MSAIHLEDDDALLEDIFEVWTPSEVKNYVATVAAGFNALANDINAKPNALTATDMQAWATLLANFLKFYKGVGFFASLSMGAVRTAETYATQLAHWREVFATKAGQQPTGAAVVIPSAGQNQNMFRVLDTVKLVSIAGAIFGVGYLVHQAMNVTRGRR